MATFFTKWFDSSDIYLSLSLSLSIFQNEKYCGMSIFMEPLRGSFASLTSPLRGLKNKFISKKLSIFWINFCRCNNLIFFFFFEKKNSWYADNIRLCAFLEDETSIFGNFTSFLTLSMFGYHGRTGILFGLISLIYITDKRNPGFDQHKENLFLSGYENPKFLSGYMMFAS